MLKQIFTSIILTLSLPITQAEDVPSLAEDPSTINRHKSKPTAEKPWTKKTPAELRKWAKENLHFKLIGKRIITDEENPEWAWFRKSGLGIFLHWGLASVPPANGDAWACVWNNHRSKNNLLQLPEDMFAAADTWNPENYDPNQWMAAASQAGFGYAVLTTRHHDGYCLWPTRHGNWDTGEKMNGRDLVKGYVDACRKHNIKIGFYYSGPNWHSYYKLKDFSHPPVGYNYKLEKVGKEAGLVPLMGGGQLPPELAKKEHAESHGQVTELLTNYGKIDMMWWDGNSIMQEKEVHQLQPNTFVARGNIATPEGIHQGASQNVKVSNECGWWWEMCVKAENKHSPNWHYNPRNEAPGNHWTTNTLLTELIRCRSLGGNLLVNITPRPDGSMMDWYYQTCREMAAWMKHSREAIYDVQLTAPLPTLDKTQNFTTLAKDGTLYSLHDQEGKILINSIAKPESVTLLRTGEALHHTFENNTLSLTLDKEKQSPLPDLVKITFPKQPVSRADWLDEDKFGLFIHWGLYSQIARGEWYMHSKKTPIEEYSKLTKTCNPTKFDAAEWVKIAKGAGMKYIVITSKHHDGFALFDSKVSDYNIVQATPFKRDMIAELKQACDAQDIKLGLYYSHAQDWYHRGGSPSYNWKEPSGMDEMKDYLKNISLPQVKEILTRYQPAIIWYDTPRRMNPTLAKPFSEVVREISPTTLINSRIALDGNKMDKVSQKDLDMLKGLDTDYLSYADREIPAHSPWDKWETCMTLNGAWGYTQGDDAWKSPTRVIQQLLEVVSKNGAFLLNVGPTAEGEFPARSVEVLQQVGNWLKANGKAVYGAKPVSFNLPGTPTAESLKRKAEKEARFAKLNRPAPHTSLERTFPWIATQNNNTIYLTLFEWPANNTLTIDNFRENISSVHLSTTPDLALKHTHSKETLTISLPERPAGKLPPVLHLKTKPLTIIRQ